VFELYTEKARRVIFYARYAASEYGSPYIDTEHLLLGLVRDSPAVIVSFAPEERKSTIVHDLQQSVDAISARRPTISTSVDLPLSSEGKRVLGYAAEQAQRRGDNHIGTEHLLLGLLQDNNTAACHILNRHGITLADAQTATDVERNIPQRAPTTLAWFMDAENVNLGSANLTEFAPVPRIGETVWFGGDEKYTVVNVRYDFERVAQAAESTYLLNRVVVSLHKTFKPSLNPNNPLSST
jgi:ATP-dependent Clp protease ATP-binding subunit ClpA